MSKIDKIGDGKVKVLKPKRMFFSMKKFKKVLAGLLITSTILGASFMFSGCKTSCKPEQEPPAIVNPLPDDPTPDDPTPDVPPIVAENIEFNEFMRDHKVEAKEFVNQFIKNSLTGGKETYAENWMFTKDTDETLKSISLNYVYAGEGHTRVNEIVTIEFNNPVLLQDILDGKIDVNDVTGNITRKEVFSYDAKVNYLNEDLNKALADACGVITGTAFKEIEGTETTQKFEVLATDANSNYMVYTVEVEKGADTAELIANLSDTNKTQVSSPETTVFDNNSVSNDQLPVKEYAPETFLPESVEDLIENYSDSVHTVLNNCFYPVATSEIFGRTYDESKLVDAEWRIISEENSVTGLMFITDYENMTNNIIHTTTSINLSESIDIVEFVNEDAYTTFSTVAENSTYTREHSFGYIKDQHGTRNDLANAIFEAKGMGLEAPEGAERYLVESSAYLDEVLHESRIFKLYQVEDDNVTEFTLFIKEKSSDELYIEALNDASNYYFTSEKSVETPGYVLEYKVLANEADYEAEMEM